MIIDTAQGEYIIMGKNYFFIEKKEEFQDLKLRNI